MVAIVIVGGGIMGVSTAYFLAKRGIPVTILDSVGLACAASGRAGGFLAKDWCSHYEVDILAKKGFELHMEIFKEVGSVCDYRNVDTYSVSIGSGKKEKSTYRALDWIDGNLTGCSKLGNTTTTGQVHPQKLSAELFRRAQQLTQNATSLRIAKVNGLEFSPTESTESNRKVVGVRLAENQELIPADYVLLTTGPWTQKAIGWLPIGCLPTQGFRGQRAHGVVLRPTSTTASTIGPTCLFTEYSDEGGACSPEVYPRPDGTVYICGLSDNQPVPDSPTDVVVESWRCKKLAEVVGKAASGLKNAEIVTEQACYLPLSPDGLPVIGRVPAVRGVYIATGHSCWGILTGPITGRLLAAILCSDLPPEQRSTSLISPNDAEAEDKEGQKLLSNSKMKAFDPARLAHDAQEQAKCRVTKRS